MLRLMKNLITVLAILASPTSMAAMSLNEGIGELTSFIYSELKHEGYLKNRRLAFYGFRDAQTDKGCRALSYFLADQVKSEFNSFRRIARDKFEVIPRDGFERVELEYLFQQGGVASDVNAIRIMGPSDIIVTGDWQADGSRFRLSLKAQRIKSRKTVEITAKTLTLETFGLPAEAQSCLSSSGSPPSGSSDVQALQKTVSDFNRQIDQLRQQAKNTEKKRALIKVIEKKKKTINQLKRASSSGTVTYTSRRYDENIAFLRLTTEPSGLDVYINDQWVGTSPIERYEVEAGVEVKVTARGDERYYKPASFKQSFEQFVDTSKSLTIEKGQGRLLLVGKKAKVASVSGDAGYYDLTQSRKPIVTLAAGKHRLKLRDANKGIAEIEVDLWDGDLQRHDIGFRQLTDAELKQMMIGKMITVPAGSFMMGSNKYDDEKPPHSVKVRSFKLGETEVTQAQWRAVMGSNPSGFSGCNSCPVEQVSWNDIHSYIKKLNEKTGERYRLPSEAEWEYACRSGGKEEEYCGGNDVSKVAWYENNSGSKTHAVKGKQPNGLGLYDMSGNVWEWVQDCYHDSYAGAPTDGSAREDGACDYHYRVLRGGSWNDRPNLLRSASRYRGTPSPPRGTNVGFRLAQDL